MKKQTTVETSGKITVTKSEERYPYAGEVLMTHGFIIIFLNMSFGMLPVTIWGTRMNYYKCSVAELHTVVTTLCFIIFSAIFIQVVFFPNEGADGEKRSMTNFVILMALGITHIVGYTILLVRGHFVARKFPEVWEKLSKLLQIAVLDIYGTDCHLLKQARSFARWALWEYTWITIGTVFGNIMLSEEYVYGLNESIEHYKLDYVLPHEWGEMTMLDKYKMICLKGSYFIWQLCNSCHVLGTMLLCYIVMIVTICLKSVNQQIQEVFEIVEGGSSCEPCLGVKTPKIKFNWGGPSMKKNRNCRTEDNTHDSMSTNCRDDEIIERLDKTGRIILMIEDVLYLVSKLWGISLIVQALILITKGTTQVYEFLHFFTKEDNSSDFLYYNIPPWDVWLGMVDTVLVHFYFLFKCCIYVDRMQFEVKTTMVLLKQPNCYRLPTKIYEKVQVLKQDLSSATVTLSASNYFQINKFLLTSIAAQVATYVIVLLQFSQQDAWRNGKNGMGSGTNYINLFKQKLK